MFLNTFNKEKVIEVFKEIQSKNIKDLVFDSYNWHEITTAKFLKINYCNYLHKISIETYDPNNELFENPSCTCKIAPYDVFIAKLMPSSDYYDLISK